MFMLINNKYLLNYNLRNLLLQVEMNNTTIMLLILNLKNNSLDRGILFNNYKSNTFYSINLFLFSLFYIVTIVNK